VPRHPSFLLKIKIKQPYSTSLSFSLSPPLLLSLSLSLFLPLSFSVSLSLSLSLSLPPSLSLSLSPSISRLLRWKLFTKVINLPSQKAWVERPVGQVKKGRKRKWS
jgi:hypothetical protein